MDKVGSYQLGLGVELSLWRGDVFDLTADVCVVGKSKHFMSRLLEHEALEFEPLNTSASPVRDTQVARAKALPWKTVVRIAYHSGPRGPYGFAPNKMPHVVSLAMDLLNIFSEMLHQREVRRIALVPLSGWNPDTVAAATVDAISRVQRPFNSSGKIEFMQCDLVDPSPYVKWCENRWDIMEWWVAKLENWYQKA